MPSAQRKDEQRRTRRYMAMKSHAHRDRTRQERIIQLKECKEAGTISEKHDKELAKLSGQQKYYAAVSNKKEKRKQAAKVLKRRHLIKTKVEAGKATPEERREHQQHQEWARLRRIKLRAKFAARKAKKERNAREKALARTTEGETGCPVANTTTFALP